MCEQKAQLAVLSHARLATIVNYYPRLPLFTTWSFPFPFSFFEFCIAFSHSHSYAQISIRVARYAKLSFSTENNGLHLQCVSTASLALPGASTTTVFAASIRPLRCNTFPKVFSCLYIFFTLFLHFFFFFSLLYLSFFVFYSEKKCLRGQVFLVGSSVDSKETAKAVITFKSTFFLIALTLRYLLGSLRLFLCFVESAEDWEAEALTAQEKKGKEELKAPYSWLVGFQVEFFFSLSSIYFWLFVRREEGNQERKGA